MKKEVLPWLKIFEKQKRDMQFDLNLHHVKNEK
jgi:hypothetical protein